MRMPKERKAPIMPAQNANSRYSVPMSLWFVERNQRAKNPGMWWSWASWAPAWVACVAI